MCSSAEVSREAAIRDGKGSGSQLSQEGRKESSRRWGSMHRFRCGAGAPSSSGQQGAPQGLRARDASKASRQMEEEAETGQKTRRGVACGLLEEGRMWSPFKRVDWGAWVAQ